MKRWLRRPFLSSVDVLDDAGDVRPLADIERDVIALAMARYGSPSRVARLLGIGRSTLYRKIGPPGDNGKRIPPGWTRPGDSG